MVCSKTAKSGHIELSVKELTGSLSVAASGIPEARSDHAVIMARFAADCLKKVDILSKKLEIQYGPDTSELFLRVALHSGPVTGGFMKGSQSRFQLFGDTMTTAGLIHKSGMSNRVHLSEATAKLLIQAGKQNWVEEREGKIYTQEKGELQTFWLTRYRKSPNHAADGRSIADTNPSDDGGEDDFYGLDSEGRWIEWNTEVLRTMLKNVASRREERRGSGDHRLISLDAPGGMPLEEVKEIIELPAFDKEVARRLRERGDRDVPAEVVDELRDYVTQVSVLNNGSSGKHFIDSHASLCYSFAMKHTGSWDVRGQCKSWNFVALSLSVFVSPVASVSLFGLRFHCSHSITLLMRPTW